jgi:hypothetical protein
MKAYCRAIPLLSLGLFLFCVPFPCDASETKSPQFIEIDGACCPAEVDGRLAYKVLAGERRFRIVFDGKKGKPYVQIEKISDVGGKLTYLAETEKWRWVIVHDGQEIGHEYDDVSWPIEIGEQLAYIAKKGDEHLVIVGGEVIYSGPETVLSLHEVGGRPAFVVSTGMNWHIIYEGKVVQGPYKRTSFPTDIDGRLAYIAVTESGQQIAVFDGKEDGRDYESVWPYLWDYKGQLAFSASRKDGSRDGKWFAVLNGVETGLQYMDATDLEVENDQFTYVGYLNDDLHSSRIVYKGKEYGASYDYVLQPAIREGRFFYKAHKNGKQCVVLEGSEGKWYEDIHGGWVMVSGKLVYMVADGGRRFLVVEQ